MSTLQALNSFSLEALSLTQFQRKQTCPTVFCKMEDALSAQAPKRHFVAQSSSRSTLASTRTPGPERADSAFRVLSSVQPRTALRKPHYQTLLTSALPGMETCVGLQHQTLLLMNVGMDTHPPTCARSVAVDPRN